MYKINSQEFIIRIVFQKNNTWQGQIICLETKEEINFKSALEMILIINEKLGVNQIENTDLLNKLVEESETAPN